MGSLPCVTCGRDDCAHLIRTLEKHSSENDAWREPPPGWFTFGAHVDQPVRLEFSEATDEALMPLWERPMPPGATAGA